MPLILRKLTSGREILCHQTSSTLEMRLTVVINDHRLESLTLHFLVKKLKIDKCSEKYIAHF